MNNSELYEKMKRSEIKIKSEIEIKEEPIENYNEGFCEEENLNSDLLKHLEQTNERRIYNSSSADPKLPVKFEDNNFNMEIDLDYEVKIEDTLDENERMENVTEGKCDIKKKNDCEVKKECVWEENEDVPSEAQRKTRIPLFGLNTDNDIQFHQLEASEIPKEIVQKANVEEEKNKLINIKTGFNNGRGGVNILLNSSKDENKKHHTINLDQNERIVIDQTEASCSQQEGPISNTLSCSLYEFQTENVRSLKSHLSFHSEMFKCSECDYVCIRKRNLKRHLLSHSTTKPFKCSECDYACISKCYLKRHLLSHLNVKLFKCSECNYSCNYEPSLKQHMLTHFNTKLFKCSECDYSCTQKGNLKRHLLSHSTTKLFKCAECDYACNQKRYLQKHIESHLNLKLIKCTECDFSCYYKQKLKDHMLTHSNTKIFTCSECDYSFKHKRSLKAHMLSHLNGEKFFKCSECDFSSNYKSSLKAHLLSHSNVFKCSECDYSTNRKSSLKAHLLSHSNVAGEPSCLFFSLPSKGRGNKGRLLKVTSNQTHEKFEKEK